MFILNEKPLSPDVAFEAEVGGDTIQFPANWLRLATPEEREAVGITEVPDPTPVDQRFWWDTGIPKDHAQLVEQWIGQVKQTAGSLLSSTDWYVTRNAETGINIPQEVLDRRAEIRGYSNTKELAILSTTSTEELAALVTDSDFNQWEEVQPSGEDSLVVDGTSTDTLIS